MTSRAGTVAGLDTICPFLPGLEGALADESVSEIMINGAGAFWVESKGRMRRVEAPQLTSAALQRAALQIVRPLGGELSRTKPVADARLGDGSRVAVAMPPAAADVMITIRCFGRRQFTAGDLLNNGSLPEAVLLDVLAALEDRKNVIVSGATGSGKTTMLSAICGLVPMDDRVLVIEDTMEIRLGAPNCVRFEARGVTVRDLVRHALRHRPDRIVVGEVRGGEAADLLDALSGVASAGVLPWQAPKQGAPSWNLRWRGWNRAG